MTTSIFAFIIVLGVLIFFHELGHFLMARLFGVGVEKFSLGFGPKIVGFTSGLTDYRISLIPLGGYVKMVGEEPDEELPPEEIHLSFTHKPVWQRFLIVAAGPVFNFVLPLFIFFGLALFYGSATLEPVIGEVQKNMPAQAAGLLAGDRVVSINQVALDSWEEMALIIGQSQGQELVVDVVRSNGEPATIQVAPQQVDGLTIFGEPEKRYVLGVLAAGEMRRARLGPVAAAAESLRQTGYIIRLTIIGVGKIFSGSVSTKELGGPILIAQMSGKAAQQGLGSLLAFIAFISINLGILNLLPIPVLDGGHLFFFAIEALFRRPLPVKVRELAQQAGMMALLLLMVLVIYNDIMR